MKHRGIIMEFKDKYKSWRKEVNFSYEEIYYRIEIEPKVQEEWESGKVIPPRYVQRLVEMWFDEVFQNNLLWENDK